MTYKYRERYIHFFFLSSLHNFSFGLSSIKKVTEGWPPLSTNCARTIKYRGKKEKRRKKKKKKREKKPADNSLSVYHSRVYAIL